MTRSVTAIELLTIDGWYQIRMMGLGDAYGDFWGTPV